MKEKQSLERDPMSVGSLKENALFEDTNNGFSDSDDFSLQELLMWDLDMLDC